MRYLLKVIFFSVILAITVTSQAQIGTRFPSEKKVIKDPVTSAKLVFLTTQQDKGDTKIYQTHNQWTSDGKWLVFRSNRVFGEAMAVNEKTGDIVQVTEGGYMGMLNVSRKSMKLYFMRNVLNEGEKPLRFDKISLDSVRDKNPMDFYRLRNHAIEVIEVDLERLFADSKSGKLKNASVYQRVCGTTPKEIGAGGDMALDGDEQWVYFRIGKEEAARHLSDSVKIEKNFGPRGMGEGPSGLASMNLKTGEVRHVISVPFQVGHIQTNPWVPGEIVFCWETGGKSPQRTWTVRSDGSGLRPLYRENGHDWVTHEAVISKDEVAVAILGHRKIKDRPTDLQNDIPDAYNPGQEATWGDCGTREYPTGLGIVNLRTHEIMIAGQTDNGSGIWHVHGSSDGRWATGDDFARNIYLIDRKTREMILLSAGHKFTAADHPHPTFSPDGSRIEIQSAMLSEDNKSMNICIVHLPKSWLKR